MQKLLIVWTCYLLVISLYTTPNHCVKQFYNTSGNHSQFIVLNHFIIPLCKQFTSNFLNERYNLKEGKILFKPTKASEEQFRPNLDMALSYFIGGEDSFCKEDQGFAMKPWIKVSFENSGFIFEKNRAIAMGNYFFTDLNEKTIKVEYSFGYKLIEKTL